jgi:hypothetical protein
MDQANAKGHDNWAARWPADRVQRLKELWPTMSASQIGHAMGLSRMAIIGKVHRLGLTLKKSDRLLAPKRGGQRRPKKIFTPPPPISAPLVPETVLADMPAPNFLFRTIEELGVAQCRYPCGDSVPYLFCAAATDGSSFCPYHKRMAYHRILPARRFGECVEP